MTDLKALRADLAKYRDALEERKQQLAEEIREAMERFQEDTGLSAHIGVEKQDVRGIGDEHSRPLICGVTVDVDTGWL